MASWNCGTMAMNIKFIASAEFAATSLTVRGSTASYHVKQVK
jgi:hypothetical protein